MKVKIKKINVEFPKLEPRTLLNPKLSINPNEKMQSKLGQSIPIVSHKISEPKKMNRTPKASLVKPPTGGINLPKRHKDMQIGIIIHLKILLSFNLVFIFFLFS